MCGLFGYVGREAVDIERLSYVAELASYRGPHGFGFAYTITGEAFGNFRQLGSLDKKLDTLSMLQGATAIIGQCRLATSGSISVDDGQPLQAGPGYLVHNGNVYEHQAIAARHQLKLTTHCDSETLALLIARRRKGAGMRDAIYWAVRQTAIYLQPYALLTLWPTKRASVAMIRHDHPLYFDGAYICSLPFQGSQLIQEDIVQEYFLVQEEKVNRAEAGFVDDAATAPTALEVDPTRRHQAE